MKANFVTLSACLAASLFSVQLYAESNDTDQWNRKAAAGYLDQRASWWMGWPSAARDHGTFCVSCHTALPYALGRPALRGALAEQGPSPDERKLLDNIIKRVKMWNEVLPFYSDEDRGAPKTAESRGTESVLNALILVSYDVPSGKLSAESRQALDNMWALQLKTGEKKGALTWLNFHNEPWEADDSQYWGATLAALAVGTAPKDYQMIPEVQENTKLLIGYLQKEQPSQSLIIRVGLLWASTKVPGLLTAKQQKSIVDEALSKQQEDGGWSTSSVVISTWKRRDGTAMDTKSDGYATGLISLALQRAGVSRTDPKIKQSLAWLTRNQSSTEGNWPSTSLNKQRDPVSDAGRFMSDAATAYSVLALSDGK